MYMFAIANPCETSSVLRTIHFILEIIKIVMILVPIGLVIMISVDFAKNIISSEEEMEKNKKLAIKRLIMCIFLFLVPTIVKTTFNTLFDSDIMVNYTQCIANARTDAILRFEEQEAFFEEIVENNMVAPTDPESTRVIISKNNSNGETSVKDNNSEDNDSTTINADTREFVNALDKMSQVVERARKTGKHWKYSNSGTSGSFDTALSNNNKKTNCAKYVSWGLVKIGILKKGQSFYKCYGGSHCSGNNIVYSGDNAKKRMEKNLSYIKGDGETAAKLIKNKKIIKGDIILWKNEQHTNVYAGNNKWYDAGRWAANGAKGDLKFNTFGPVKIPSLNHWRVWKILRIKE